ncbi:uncharacterized protein LOC118761119 [Octopus sinensis]|uniref:Uncharacterized protein LOC118761119 n=1 Tax=Octopus sinensis TaxID=2607531 RepID=A0A7E6EI81_9MOLL|nr:uncharacterized protein LOC118761119 [Octopus sinensis]
MGNRRHGQFVYATNHLLFMDDIKLIYQSDTMEKIEPGEFEQIDKNVRRILMESHIHMRPANKEKLYLPRNKLGRGLECVSNKSERMLFQFYHDLKHKADYCLRREGILRVVNSKKTHMATIVEFISRKYNIENINELTITKLVEIQHEYLIRQIETKPLHSILFQFVEIRVDTTITDTAVSNGKPDIFVHDKVRNTITLIEVGITSQNYLKQAEVEKFHKYNLLANELGAIHRAKVKIIPVVLTWDEIVSRFFKSHLNSIAVEDRVKAYIQTLVLRKTLESMQVETRHGISVPEEEQAVIECQPKDSSE